MPRPYFEFLLSYNTDASYFPDVPDAAERSGVTIGVVNLQPRSVGTVRLASADPLDSPLIDPAYLSDQADVDLLVKGLRMAQQVAAAPALKPWAENIVPALDATDEEVAQHVRDDAAITFHSVGTVRMGRVDDPDAVLDPQLRVKGVQGLRVADASVMPDLIRGHTVAPSVFIGWRAADLITER
ncbi:MAG: hypothetical protein GX875_05485 [Propionibacterium sp.]|nr:hypothetical protein [Propionibacterium sp.]